ncbi:hypothetical protein AB6A40_011459 [Gnathostoma spinigerum]|uniref:Irg-7-like Ig-like domain-containing protein n=1 Tax=Gnathostoma spinigerum TaxID=75299 RepID=A0ABD6F4P7_9BILA
MSGQSFVWVGFVGSENITKDITQRSPLKGKNRIVAHVGIGTEASFGDVTLAHLIDFSTGKLKVLPFKKRVGCAYDFISKAFMCDRGSPFTMVVFGKDSNGIRFRRHIGTFELFG